MLRCPSTHRQAAQTKTLHNFKNHLARYHTPAPMATPPWSLNASKRGTMENVPQ
jgi:hypothetical protein